MLYKEFENLNITEKDKKLNAEFNTPFELRKIFIDYLINNNIDKNINILENSCGKGGFLFDLEKENYNNLFFGDINENNVNYCKNKLKNYKYCFCDDFLKHDFNIKFDLIIGNPPWNMPKTKNFKSNGNNLWERFLIKSLKLLKNDGLLMYILPATWRKPSIFTKYKIYNYLKDFNIKYIKMITKKNAMKYFNICIPFDLLIIENNNYELKTKIIDQLNNEYNINIKNYPFLSNYKLEYLDEFLNSYFNFNIFKNNYRYTNYEIKGDVKLLHSFNKENDKLRFIYKDKKYDFNFDKIIFSISSNTLKYMVDLKNEYNLSSNLFCIKYNEEFLKLLKNDRFIEFINSCSYSVFTFEYKIFLYF